MEVFFSDLAELKLKSLTNYLLEEWSYEVKTEFLAKLTAKIDHISIYPESCPKTSNYGGIYKCVVTKQTTFFYRVNFVDEEIEIITLFDTRQDPNKIDKHLD